MGQDLLAEPWRTMLAAFAAVAILALIFALLRLLRARTGVHPEITRKFLHVSMGLVVAAFPWLFATPAPVIVLGLLSALALVAARVIPAFKSRTGGVIDGVKRFSLGEIYFPLSISLLFYLSHEHWLLYVIPILVLALGDALAALIGISYGRVRYLTTEGMKSVEGSIAFFTVAFLTVHIPLLLFSTVGRAESLLIALMIGLIVMMLEAIAWRGLDNVLIPIGTWLLLVIYLPLTPQALVLRFCVTAVLTLFVFYWRSRTTMDDAALVTVALYGYIAFMIGGPLWAIAPLALFITHVARFPRAVNIDARRAAGLSDTPREGRTHSVRAVLSICLPSLVCLLAYAVTADHRLLVPHVVSFSIRIATVCFSFHGMKYYVTSDCARRPPLLTTVLIAWATTCLLTALPAILLQFLPHHASAVWLSLALITFTLTLAAGWTFCRLLSRLYHPHPIALAIDATGLVLSSIAALISYGVTRQFV